MITWEEIKGIRINWKEIRKINPMEIYLHCSKGFYGYFIGTCQVAMPVFHPYEPVYNPETMRNFPYKKFNRWIFWSYIIHTNFVLIKTSLGMYYFRWVKSLNSTVKIHGERVLLSQPPDWIKIVHLVQIKK